VSHKDTRAPWQVQADRLMDELFPPGTMTDEEVFFVCEVMQTIHTL
jgi:hypothetical protein